MLAGSLPSVSLLAGAQRVLAADRSPAEILNEIEQVRLPEQDPSKLEDDDYGREWRAQFDAGIEKRASLILEFYKAAPEREKVPSLMFMRWDKMINIGKKSRVEGEINEVLAKTKNQKLRREAAFERLHLSMIQVRRLVLLVGRILHAPDDDAGRGLPEIRAATNETESVSVIRDNAKLSQLTESR